MSGLPLKEELEKSFYEFRYSRDRELIIVYKRDPDMYGPDVLCIFNIISEKFLFEGHTYSINQFKRVLKLLSFI
jgi:hypothetical protein